MHFSDREVVILKPTSVFLSFLSAQAPNVNLPDLSIMQSDTTAYTITKQDGEEETLDEIERHFSRMFRYEICRWLGDGARNDIEGSFLDFLCCFKFEMHSQMLVEEDNLKKTSQLLCIKPRSVLLKWIKMTASENSGDCEVMERVSLTQLSENATVVIKTFKQQSDILPFIQNNYASMLKMETRRMDAHSDEWPNVKSFEDFIRYFAVEIHSQLVHMY